MLNDENGGGGLFGGDSPLSESDEQDVADQVEFEENDPEGWDEYSAGLDQDNADRAESGEPEA